MTTQEKKKGLEDILVDIDDIVSNALHGFEGIDAKTFVDSRWGEIEAKARNLLEDLAYYKTEAGYFIYNSLNRELVGYFASRLSGGINIQTYALVNLENPSLANGVEVVARALVPLNLTLNALEEASEGDILKEVTSKFNDGVPSRFLIYSDHSETIPPSVIPRLVTRVVMLRTPVNKGEIVDRIRDELYAKLKTQKISDLPQSRKEFSAHLRNAVGASNSEEMYDLLEQLVIYTISLRDLVRENSEAMGDSFLKRAPGWVTAFQEVILKNIRRPIAFLAWGIKGQSFPDKYLVSTYAGFLQEAYDKGVLQKYLVKKGITFDRRPKGRDLSDLVRYRTLTFGDPIPEDLVAYVKKRKQNPNSAEEQMAEQLLFEVITEITGQRLSSIEMELEVDRLRTFENIEEYCIYIPEAMLVKINARRGSPGVPNVTGPKYKISGEEYYAIDAKELVPYVSFFKGKLKLQRKETLHDGVRVNWADPDAYENLISHPKENGYMAVHIRLEADSSNYSYLPSLEWQLKTNVNDALQEKEQRQDHEAYRNWQLAMVDFLIEQGVLGLTKRRTSLSQEISKEDLRIAQSEGEARVYLIRKLLSPNHEYVGMHFGT